MSKEEVIYQAPSKEEQNAKRRKNGLFREKVLEIYNKFPFANPAADVMHRKIIDGTYELNFDEFEQLLRVWGSDKLFDLSSNDGKSLLEIIVRYGSFQDFKIFQGFVENDVSIDILTIHSWASESGNVIFLGLV